MRNWFHIGVFLTTWLFWLLPALGTPLSGPHPVLRVVDGDTIVIRYHGRTEKIRLLNVDTPESVHPDPSRNSELGRQASAYTKSRLSGRQVHLAFENKKRGNYGRLLAYVIVDKSNFNIELVRQGWSPYYTKYGISQSFHDAFLAAEAEARKRRRAVWAQEAPPAGGGITQSGAEKRQTASLGLIRGNSNSKVFHTPGCRWYDCKHCTRSFPSREAARAAGFRPCSHCSKSP